MNPFEAWHMVDDLLHAQRRLMRYKHMPSITTEDIEREEAKLAELRSRIIAIMTEGAG